MLIWKVKIPSKIYTNWVLQNGNGDTSESKQDQWLQQKSVVGQSNITLEKEADVSQESSFLWLAKAREFVVWPSVKQENMFMFRYCVGFQFDSAEFTQIAQCSNSDSVFWWKIPICTDVSFASGKW